MVLTWEEYHGMNATQRKNVKRPELQLLIDEQMNADNPATIRGIIRDELKTQIDSLEKKITKKYDKKIKDVEDENDRLKKENLEIKAAVSEQQKFLERLRSKENANNIFMSGLPNQMDIDGANIDDAKVIINHVLKFVNPAIKPEDYKILKSFEPREGHDRHSAKICCTGQNVKKKTFEGCRKFKDLPEESPIKKVFLKNEDTPLQKKENDRLYNHLQRPPCPRGGSRKPREYIQTAIGKAVQERRRGS